MNARLLVGISIIAVSTCAAQSSNVKLSYGTSGLSSIQYNGFEYLSSGSFGVNAVIFGTQGHTSPGSTSRTTAYDPAHSQTTLTFNWGKISIVYSTAGNSFRMTVTTTNSSSQPVEGVFYEPLHLQFPSKPQEFDGVDPILGLNMGSPTALRMTAGANALVLVNEDVIKPLLIGFPWSFNKPTSTIFPVRIETSQDSMLPNSLPFINRPIAPGASDTYQISLRFGAASASTKSLVSDVYQAFATAFPFTVKWTDRRPIGQLIIGRTATGWPTNPRGWLNDPTVDVTTPQGVANFQSRLLTWAKNAVVILKSMNAQGMVTWDIEGEQYPQPTTYIGDPTVAGSLAPEMNGVIDQYFKTFTDAGFRVGICIRPQQLVIPSGGGAPAQTAVGDPTQLLLNKISYANKRWGATLFYIDSNGDPNYPMDAQFFQNVAKQYPQVLLMPENQTSEYYSVSAPYNELKGGFNSTPQSVLDIYPSAFSVIYTPDGNFAQNQSALQTAVKRGDVLMFRAWYADPQNQPLLNLYPSNGVAPPAPTIATPAQGSTVAGTVNVTARVSAGVLPVKSVQYVLDGANSGSPILGAPYSYALNSAGLAPGLHSLEAIASDTIGDLGFTGSFFFVGSSQGGSPPPVVSIDAPGNGASLSGAVAVSAEVSASAPVSGVVLQIDGVQTGSSDSTAPWQWSWNTLGLSNGAHTLTVTATDENGQAGSATETVLVSNVSLAVSFSAPQAGSSVSGTVALTAIVAGPAPIASVQFAVDGSALGSSDTSSPYQVNWNSAAVPDGSHTLSATVTDALGNHSSTSINVTSHNAQGGGNGNLSRAWTTPSGIQNLTSIGTADWVHWGMEGPGGVDRKGFGNAQIGPIQLVGSDVVRSFGNNPFAFSWSDGDPTVQTGGTATGLWVSSEGNGFSVTVPADTVARTLKVYLGVYKSRGLITATLSDGSAPDLVDTSVWNLQGRLSVAYTLYYQAASAGETLTVTFTRAVGSNDPAGNVTMEAAALAVTGDR